MQTKYNIINFVLFLAALSVAVAVSLIDHSVATLAASALILTISLLYSIIGNKEQRKDRIKLGLSIYCIYVVSALIFSQPFSETTYFIVVDPMHYLEWFMPDRTFYMTWEHFYDCYVGLADNNAIYNAYILLWTVIGNVHLGGATAYYMTLAQTLFGILCIITLHRIISMYFDKKKAMHYTLLFGCCSLFLFYSCVIIRDIVIALFFMLAVEILLKPFRWRRMGLLCLYVLVVWGLRLYSGFFFVVFPALYMYIYLKKSRFKLLWLAGFYLVLVIGAVVVFGSGAMEQTTEELEMYDNQTASTEGLVASLMKLPPGIRHVAVMLTSQMNPFPPFLVFRHEITSVSNLYMCLTVFAYEFFWFFVFFMLAYCFIGKRSYRQLPWTDIMLLLIAIVYILANTSHPDIRRMMPVYPIIYLAYLKTKEQIVDKHWFFTRRQILFGLYVMLMFVYVAFKGV